jgi:hypothetical protein
MTVQGAIEVPAQRRRLAVMLAINLVCVLVGASAAIGAFAYRIGWLDYVFAAAILVGFAAHIWLMLGLARGAGPKGSV